MLGWLKFLFLQSTERLFTAFRICIYPCLYTIRAFASFWKTLSFEKQTVQWQSLKLRYLVSIEWSRDYHKAKLSMKQTIMGNENFVTQRFHISVIPKEYTTSNLISPWGSHAGNESILSKVLHFYDINVRCKLIYSVYIREIIFTQYLPLLLFLR